MKTEDDSKRYLLYRYFGTGRDARKRYLADFYDGKYGQQNRTMIRRKAERYTARIALQLATSRELFIELY